MVMGGVRQSVLSEEAIRQIRRAVQEALNAIVDGLWVVAQAKNGKVVTAEIWANEDDARQRFIDLTEDEGPDGDTAMFCVFTETTGAERCDGDYEHDERNELWVNMMEHAMDELATTSDEGRKGVIKTLLKLFEDGDRSDALYKALSEVETAS